MHPPSRNVLGSSATTTSSELPVFVQTLEYRRSVEFCEGCRRDRYIGLCYGPPGVGKTLSGIHFSRSARILPIDRWSVRTSDGQALDTIFYTPDVITSPSQIRNDLRRAREIVSSTAQRPARDESRARLEEVRMRDEAWRAEHRNDPSYIHGGPVPLTPTYFQVFEEYEAKLRLITDPTSLIIVDEADRLTMNGLEQLRSTFDDSGLGMVLIGMPGIEKRVSRYPQFFSRIGFVHEFRPLPDSDVEMLLRSHWAPTGVQLPKNEVSPEVAAAITRLTRGNFRLLTRLLTQMQRVVEINQLSEFAIDVVETARENLVIGQA